MRFNAWLVATAVCFTASAAAAEAQDRAGYEREMSVSAGATLDCYEQALIRADDGASAAQTVAEKLKGLCIAEWAHFEDVVGQPLAPSDRIALHSVIQEKAGPEILTLVLLERASKTTPPSMAARAMAAGSALDRCYDDTLKQADDGQSLATTVADRVMGACSEDWLRFEDAFGKVLRPDDRNALGALIEQKKQSEALMEVLLERAESGLAP